MNLNPCADTVAETALLDATEVSFTRHVSFTSRVDPKFRLVETQHRGCWEIIYYVLSFDGSVSWTRDGWATRGELADSVYTEAGFYSDDDLAVEIKRAWAARDQAEAACVRSAMLP